ncbi:MAG: hypothetical protein R3F49_06070 [Planctomycetota bacterium]
MTSAHPTPCIARRAQLVVDGSPAQLDAPAARLFWPSRVARANTKRALRDSLRCDAEPPGAAPTDVDLLCLELGPARSYLIPGARLGDPVRHRLRRPAAIGPERRHGAAAALEPVALGRRMCLLVVPYGGLDVRVEGAPIVGFALLNVGDRFHLSNGDSDQDRDRLGFGFTTYREPALFDVGLDPLGATHPRCALCRGRLVRGVRVLRCACGALLHAGWSPPIDTLDPPHLCATLGDCPDCRAELPRESGFAWLPPRSADAADSARPANAARDRRSTRVQGAASYAERYDALEARFATSVHRSLGDLDVARPWEPAVPSGSSSGSILARRPRP